MLGGSIVKVIHEFTGHIFELWRKNQQIERKMSCLRRGCIDSEGLQLCLDQLLRHLQQEYERRQIIEDKAKTNILGTTLAFSAILASVALTSGVVEAAKQNLLWILWGFIAFQFVGIVFLLLGGWFALRTLRISEIYMWTLEDEISITADRERNAEIRWYIRQNDFRSQIKANNLYVSYSCIRNGVVAFAIAAGFAQITSVASGLGW